MTSCMMNKIHYSSIFIIINRIDRFFWHCSFYRKSQQENASCIRWSLHWHSSVHKYAHEQLSSSTFCSIDVCNPINNRSMSGWGSGPFWPPPLYCCTIVIKINGKTKGGTFHSLICMYNANTIQSA